MECRKMNFSSHLKFKLDSNLAIMPSKGTPYSAGWDMYSAETVRIKPNTRALISTDIIVQLPLNTYGQLKSKSSMAYSGLDVCAGVIDQDYRGRVKVLLHNSAIYPEYLVNIGQQIAQLIVIPIEPRVAIKVEQTDETERGTGGFGSTGTYKRVCKEETYGKPGCSKY